MNPERHVHGTFTHPHVSFDAMVGVFGHLLALFNFKAGILITPLSEDNNSDITTKKRLQTEAEKR